MSPAEVRLAVWRAERANLGNAQADTFSGHF